jgi:hypothetical protein
LANKLIRYYGRGHLHFTTFTCYGRLPFRRSIRARKVFVNVLGEARDRYGTPTTAASRCKLSADL